MAFSYQEQTGDGVTTVFPFSFTGADIGYIREDDIHVYVDKVETNDFTFSGSNQVQFNVPPPAPVVAGVPNIMIRRIMPKTAPYADFSRGNNFGQEQMNYTVLQQLYAHHEFLDGFLPEGYFVKGDMDFKGNRVINIGAPVNAEDATNKAYVEEMYLAGVAPTAVAESIGAATEEDPSDGGFFSFLGAGLRKVTWARAKALLRGGVVYSSDYTTLNEAVAAIGSDRRTLKLVADVAVTANLIIPSNIELIPLNLAQINHSIYTISYAGSTARWPLAQMFNGTGKVTISNALERYAEWWGVDGVADNVQINAALDSSPNDDATVRLLAKEYVIAATVMHPAGEAPVALLGSGNYESSKGTRFKWVGGNNDSIVALPAYGVIKDVFIRNGNSSTGIIGVDLVGTSAAAGAYRSYADIENTTVKSCAYGYAFDWSWSDTITNATALYCGVGFDLRTESNSALFTNCHAVACGIGINDSNGSGARGVTWVGGSIELSTTVGIDYSYGNVSAAWVFTGTYFESNAQTAKLAKIITISDAFINGDGVAAGNPAFAIVASRGIRLENLYPAGSITNLVSFTGADAAYVAQSVTISAPYHKSLIATAIYGNPKALSLGWLHPSCYTKIETEWINTSSANNSAVSMVGENSGLAERKLVAMYMINKSTVSFAAPFVVGMGRSAGYVDLATATFASSPLASGVRNIPLVGGAPATYTSSAYNYFTSSTANSGGGYVKFVMFFI